jgi:hypothetical protein
MTSFDVPGILVNGCDARPLFASLLEYLHDSFVFTAVVSVLTLSDLAVWPNWNVSVDGFIE